MLVPYRGAVENTCLDILGGLRSACTYVGAGQLKHLSKRTTFIRVTMQTNEFFGAQPEMIDINAYSAASAAAGSAAAGTPFASPPFPSLLPSTLGSLHAKN